MPACEVRYRSAPYFVGALVCAMLYGCAHLENQDQSSQPTAAPADSPSSRRPLPTPPSQSPGEVTNRGQERGRVSTYGSEFAGRKTASGEPFDPAALTMAHRTLPFGTRVRVTNLENQRSVDVVVNDRGPFVSGRIADLSEAAASRIGMLHDGVVEALLEILQPARRP